jgi:hypothetical protein
VNSLELDSVIVQARLGSAQLGYCTSSARLLYKLGSSSAKLDSARIVYRPKSIPNIKSCKYVNYAS